MAKQNNLRFIPPILWMLVIFAFSSRPDLPSYGVDYLDFLTKKAAHVSEYVILNLLWIRAMGGKHLSLAFILSFAYSFTDEIHQLFVPGRTGALSDVAIDTSGILLSSLLALKLNLWNSRLSPLDSKKRRK